MAQVNLHFTEAGRGAPVVLLHGFPLSSSIWREQQEILSDHYRVITPDLRGHGKSPIPEGTYTMDLFAGDVIALLDKLEIEKAAIIGHSMGGYVTFALWRAAPQRFSAFGLVCSQAGADTEEAKQNREKLADKVFSTGSNAAAEAMLNRLFSPTLPTDDPNIEATRLVMISNKSMGIVNSLRGMAARPDSSDLLPEINVPTLIMTGDRDQVIAPAKAETMAAAMQNATLVMIEDAGHMPMLEQPHATALAMRNFLNELEA
jgi:3-oxoadipate enol-lactonase